MLDKFWQKEKVLIGLATLSATLGALFLNVPNPNLPGAAQEAQAKSALANIQVFWLILLTVSLTGLFVSFVKLMIEREKELQSKYDTPVGVISAVLAAIFLVIIGNFWLYIGSLYSQSLLSFINSFFTEIVSVLCFALIVFVETRRNKFTRFSTILVYSFIAAVLVTATGMAIQEIVLKYFYFYWLNLVLPALFIIFSIAYMVFCRFKKRKLFETLSLETLSKKNK